MSTKIDTSELDRLSAATEQYNALMEFVEEFLPGEQISLYQHQTGLTDIKVCYGKGGLFSDCPGEDCVLCGGEGTYEVEVADRDLPYIGSKQDLVYKFLGLDPKKIEEQRRAILAAL